MAVGVPVGGWNILVGVGVSVEPPTLLAVKKIIAPTIINNTTPTPIRSPFLVFSGVEGWATG